MATKNKNSQNQSRGEIEVRFGDEYYQGKVTLDIVRRLEGKFGCGIVKIAQRLAEGNLTMKQCASIIMLVMNAGNNDKKVKEEDVEVLIFEHGLTEGIRICGEVIAEILQTGEASGNV